MVPIACLRVERADDVWESFGCATMNVYATSHRRLRSNLPSDVAS